jgi:hypothetical protein
LECLAAVSRRFEKVNFKINATNFLFEGDRMKESVTSIRHCSNTELNLRLLTLVQKEREMLTEIILHTQEISKRKVYLEMGYPSMFAYMTEHLKYSPGSAMRRLDAAKIASETPEVLDELQTGNLNLTQLSMLEQSVRHITKTTPQRSLAKAEKLALLKKLSGKTKADSEILIAQTLCIPPQKEMKTKHQADDSVTMTLIFSKKEWDELNQIRGILSNATGGGLKETLIHLARQAIKQKTRVRPKPTATLGQHQILKGQPEVAILSLVKTDESLQTSKTASTAESVSSQRVPIPARIKNAIWRRYQACQYKDPKSGRLCGSKYFPTVEHKHPVWAGGGNEIQNLTLLCASHNTFQYKKQARLV